ncbi:hypothetical protein GGS20DRAFT_543515 [Poronia punctata]|nr:hypothetical protein GGS20DRAFT_543515 [Poronia punctata]
MIGLEDGSRTRQSHALAVGFAENKLAEFHPYFENMTAGHQQSSHYPYYPRGEGSRILRHGPREVAASLSTPGLVDQTAKLESAAPGRTPDARTEKDVFKVMKSWDKIFPLAMEEFLGMQEVKTKAPKESKSAYDIRNGHTWADVYDKLESARKYYTKQTGIDGRIWRVWRWTADHMVEPARLATKVGGSIGIVSPVFAGVQIILEAVQKGAEVRKKTLDAFDDLEDLFSDVELFMEAFPEEEPILKRAVGLVASVLLAVERVITFFTRSGLTRGLTALIKGENHEKPLLESLTTITSRSEKLMEQASKSHIRDFSRYSQATLLRLEHIMNKNSDMDATLALLMDKAEEAMEFNRRQEVRMLRLDDYIRRNTPALPNPTEPPLSLHNPPQLETQYINQETLWRLLDIMDIDTADMEMIEGKRNQLPLQDRVRTEQIVHNQTFQEWIISPTSAKLMIYSNFPGIMMEISALSLFCTKIAKAFRSRERYVCLVWFCGSHLGYDEDLDPDWSDSESDLDDDVDLIYDQEDAYSPEIKQGVIKRMMRSLIAQLLCDYDFGPMHLLPPGVDPDVIAERHSLAQLRCLFRWLVRLLPEEVTLVHLVDGIVFYEREEFEDPMLDVLGDILELTLSNDVLATTKVLVTSPRPTSTVRVGFEGEDIRTNGARVIKDSIISIDSITAAHMDISEERVNRNLGDHV